MTRKTKAAEKALKAVMASLPKAQLVSRRIPGTVALPVATNEASLLVYLHRWLAHKRRELRPTTYRVNVNELLHLTPKLGDIPLLSLTAMQIPSRPSLTGWTGDAARACGTVRRWPWPGVTSIWNTPT